MITASVKHILFVLLLRILLLSSSFNSKYFFFVLGDWRRGIRMIVQVTHSKRSIFLFVFQSTLTCPPICCPPPLQLFTRSVLLYIIRVLLILVVIIIAISVMIRINGSDGTMLSRHQYISSSILYMV